MGEYLVNNHGCDPVVMGYVYIYRTCDNPKCLKLTITKSIDQCESRNSHETQKKRGVARFSTQHF